MSQKTIIWVSCEVSSESYNINEQMPLLLSWINFNPSKYK